jgi:DNA (cytosine-5)-methyltransferase 1
MRSPIARFWQNALIVDSFAGAGGASLGIEWALGRSPDIAINHDAEAIAVHAANHPATRHYREDVWRVDPVEATRGKPVGLMWLSPDCKHFSKAKGGKPVEKRIRGLAWVAVHWAKAVRPRVIVLENVEEFADWGPIGEDGRPCPRRKGLTFRSFVGRLRGLGYDVDWQEMIAADHGAPTSRRRLFLVARCDGLPIVWPAPTHGDGLQPYRTAAECIDWSLPCPSIFERPRPLADNTLRRIAAGIQRFVIDAAQPFIVPMTHTGGVRVHAIDEPLRTVTSAQRGEFAVATPVLASLRGTERSHMHGDAISDPLRTISAGGTHHGLIVPTLVQTGYGERPGQAPRVPGLGKPLGTCVDGQKHALVAAFLAKHYGGVVGTSMRAPIGTVTATDHHSLVCALLVKFYSEGGQWARCSEPMHTIPTKDRMGLVTIGVEQYRIVDIGLRMLQPRELARAHAFPDSYILDRGAYGEEMTKTTQVRLVGNSVVPLCAEAIVRANVCGDVATVRRIA